jgi:DNA-binding NtrC family response regulator
MNILVVEDDAEILAFVSHGLRRAGYNVHCASDGLSGEKKMARAAIYDTAIVDLMLPGQDGLTLIDVSGDFHAAMPNGIPATYLADCSSTPVSVSPSGLASTVPIAFPSTNSV